jgi:CRISPR-associated endoribonuclease Cas6
MFCGLEVEDITIEEDPDLSNREYFNVGSPILIKRLTDKGTKHYKFNEPEADNFMKETLLTKMKLAGLEDDTLEISFDKDNIGASTKLVDYDGIKNRANWCSVIIKGKPETKLFAWNVGIGNSTGIGFGAIR